MSGKRTEFYSGDADGTGVLMAEDGAGHIDEVEFAVLPPGVDYIRIVGTAGSGISEVEDSVILAGYEIVGYAAAYNGSIGYLGDVAANWSVTNNGSLASTVPAILSNSSVFYSGNDVGSAIWRADYSGKNDDVRFMIRGIARMEINGSLPEVTKPGKMITLRIYFNNTGNANSRVWIRVTFPSGVTFIDFYGDEGGDNESWYISDVTPGAHYLSVNLIVNYTLPDYHLLEVDVSVNYSGGYPETIKTEQFVLDTVVCHTFIAGYVYLDGKGLKEKKVNITNTRTQESLVVETNSSGYYVIDAFDFTIPWLHGDEIGITSHYGDDTQVNTTTYLENKHWIRVDLRFRESGGDDDVICYILPIFLIIFLILVLVFWYRRKQRRNYDEG